MLVTKVIGHVEDVDVQQGRFRLENQVGNAEADAAADFVRRHQSDVLIGARRGLLQARSYWYLVINGKEGLLLTPLCGTRVVQRRRASLISGLMLILPPFPTLLASWVGSGSRFMVVLFLMLILPLGLIVLVFCVSLSLSLVPCIGLRVEATSVSHFGFLFGAFDPFRAMGWSPVAK